MGNKNSKLSTAILDDANENKYESDLQAKSNKIKKYLLDNRSLESALDVLSKIDQSLLTDAFRTFGQQIKRSSGYIANLIESEPELEDIMDEEDFEKIVNISKEYNALLLKTKNRLVSSMKDAGSRLESVNSLLKFFQRQISNTLNKKGDPNDIIDFSMLNEPKKEKLRATCNDLSEWIDVEPTSELQLEWETLRTKLEDIKNNFNKYVEKSKFGSGAIVLITLGTLLAIACITTGIIGFIGYCSAASIVYLVMGIGGSVDTVLSTGATIMTLHGAIHQLKVKKDVNHINSMIKTMIATCVDVQNGFDSIGNIEDVKKYNNKNIDAITNAGIGNRDKIIKSLIDIGDVLTVYITQGGKVVDTCSKGMEKLHKTMKKVVNR